MDSTVEQRIARYQAWRLREPVDRPMIGVLWEPDIPPLPEFLGHVGIGEEVSAEQIQPAMFLPYVERWRQRASELPGDLIQRFAPAFGIPWVEAIAGCSVEAHPGSLWAEPCLHSYADRPPIHLGQDNPWLCRLIELTRAMVAAANGRYPIAVPQMRGPLDALAAMRTPEQMCIDFVECPQDVSDVLDELTDLWIGIGQAVLDAIPPFHGGYCARMNMWAPGPAITLQNDVSTLLSPQTYNEYVLPCDEKIVRHFPFTEFHAHSSEHHQVENLLTLERLTAIEFTLEHTLGGPPLETTLPIAERVLDSKPLLLASLDIETAETCIRQLPHEGLCVMIALSAHEIPRQLDSWLMKHCDTARPARPV